MLLLHFLLHFVSLCTKHCTYIVDGGWSNWSAGNCSELCDGGTKEKTRNCSNPAPSCGGSKCIGETVETVECNTMPCIGMHMLYILSIFMYVVLLCM